MWVYGLDWAGPGQRQVAEACECRNELSGSVKCGEFLDQLQTSQLLKKDSTPWSNTTYKVRMNEILNTFATRECVHSVLYRLIFTEVCIYVIYQLFCNIRDL